MFSFRNLLALVGVTSNVALCSLVLPRQLSQQISDKFDRLYIHDRLDINAKVMFQPGHYTKRTQAQDICHTYNEKQWTGFVDVTTERQLFYWFFDSRNDPENDPVVVWINGGPGGSSMMGLFTEMGPCTVTDDSKSTTPNPFSWNNNASVLFIDQPAGTGLSPIAPGAPWPDSDETSAEDMQFFLNVFFNQIFPERAHLPIHLAGESYAGHYLPSLMDRILTDQSRKSRYALSANISSVVLVNALVENTAPYIGAWQLLCSDFRGAVFNDTACKAMATRMPECEKMTRDCRNDLDLNTCFGATYYCLTEIGVFYHDEVTAGNKSPYNIGQGCSNLPFCWDDTKGNYSTYLSQPHVLEALGLPHNFHFQAVNLDLNQAFLRSKSIFRSNAFKVSRILDSGIPVLVLNGNEDFIVNTPGQMWFYDSLPWNGQCEYRATPWKKLGQDQGFWKKTRDGSLVFVGVDGAGHAAPGDQKEIAEHIIRGWISGDDMEETLGPTKNSQ